MNYHLKFFILSLLLSSCVSVNLPGGKVTSAKDVQFAEPGTPFKSIKAANADRTWLSKKTGNTISYLSECGGTADPSLQSVETESLSALNKMQILSTDATTYNGREARQTLANGQLDGVPVQILLLIFKKNGCTYTLSYGGIEKQFSAELRQFESFKASFKAP